MAKDIFEDAQNPSEILTNVRKETERVILNAQEAIPTFERERDVEILAVGYEFDVCLFINDTGMDPEIRNDVEDELEEWLNKNDIPAEKHFHVHYDMNVVSLGLPEALEGKKS